ncbi:phage major capsid protein [Lactobacillus acetotolerans]|uniref:phage major capsid protein n=1 Tax=Lactobacillus acetotolerans TaxID=1600 RepID=UPI002FD9359E
MVKTVNALNDAWIESGQKVADYNAKLSAALLDDDFKEEDYKALKENCDKETARRDALKDQLETARAEQIVNMTPEEKKPLDNKEKSVKDKFVSDFKDMVKGDPKILNLVTSSTDPAGNAIGLTIPQDIQTAIHALVRQYDSLQEYVNAESVGTQTGSRVYEKWSDITPLKNLDDEDATIGDNDDPKLTLVKYAIKRYAGITTATNSLINDTAENILTWLSNWIAKKVVATRNEAIISVMNAVPNKPTIATFDDVKDLNLIAVDPAIAATSIYMTNQSGFAALAKVKDAMGRYLLQPNPTQPDQKMIDGKAVVVVANKWLADPVKDTHPLYFGDLKQACTLFDREQMSLLTTSVGAGAFEKDQTKIRVIDRFDVQPTDTEAFVAGSFKAISDQPANFAAGTPTTPAFDPAGNVKPTDANTVDEIKAYLTAHSIDFTGKTAKADLLALIPA